ncbi:MAG: tRNA1(Val) (adenine(37)-N6)-methyltransferase [Bacillota bacterium]
MVTLAPEERIDALLDGQLKIIQHQDVLRFSMDAILLANYVTLKTGDRVADLGTGGGVIPLILAGKRGVAYTAGFEIQEFVADMARRSVALNGLEERIAIFNMDLRKIPQELWNSFNVVVSNPPYMKPAQGLLNPKQSMAIAKYELECTLEDVLQAAARLLKPKGRAAFIYRPQRLPELLAGMMRFHMSPRRLRMVYSHADKEAEMVLVEGIFQGRAGLVVEKPLIVWTPEGDYTDEMKAIYGRE